ncbi:MAG: aminoglycoside phosphotransferase family protein [Lachnospiraceae bacterium]|nr:aminoglycoside phosphotransferase family protein [Lachnospiraceae bacterium]
MRDTFGNVLTNWDLKNPQIEEQIKEGPERPVFVIKADSGKYILKGFSCEMPEPTIESNVEAHRFLGNEKGLAPCIFPTKTGAYYLKDNGYWFYLMEFVEGRQMEETPDDEFRIGQAAAKLHRLQGYRRKSPFKQSKAGYYEWFRDRSFVKEFDAILDALPDFEKLDQCFVHTDMGPHNTMLRKNGEVVFVDLDDSGIGSRYLDLGWPFIMQFVNFNDDTEEMDYRFDLAESFLKGYYGEAGITREEFDLIFRGAEQMHISYMQSYGPYAVDSLWKILNYGIEQKEVLWNRIQGKRNL